MLEYVFSLSLSSRATFLWILPIAIGNVKRRTKNRWILNTKSMYTGNKNVIKVQGQKLCILIFSLEIHIVCIEKVVVKSFGVIDI